MPDIVARWIVVLALCVPASSAGGEPGTVQSPHGHPGRMIDLGNGIGLQSDPHGEPRPLGLPREPATPMPPGPHGDVNQQAVTPFGSPLPPNRLTPAPVLPARPNSPLIPLASTAPGAPQHSGAGTGRFGR